MQSLPAIVLRDHLVLCDADRLRVFNPTARRLWEIHQETQEIGPAIAWLVETYGLSRAQAERDVAAVLAPQPEPPAPPALEPPPRPALPQTRRASPDGWTTHYHIYDRSFSLHCATAGLARTVEPLFAHLRVETTEGPWFAIEHHDDGFTGWRDQQGLFATSTLDGAVIGLFSAILQYACAERDSLAVLHAGAVSDGHTALVLAEAGGSGKSTLTAALLARGYRYLSDDVVPLERGGCVIPAPIPLNLKVGSVPVLAELYPELPHLPAWRSGDRRLRFLSPPEFARRRPERAYPVAALVFPRYQPQAELELQPLDPVAVLTRLIESNTWLDRPLNPAKIGELCAWIDTTPAYALRYGNLAAALEALATLWP